MSEKDEQNLKNWMGWINDKVEKGKWYVKGEGAVLNIAERLGTYDETVKELEALKKKALKIQGDDRETYRQKLTADLEKARKLVKKGDFPGAQKRISLTRDRAASQLLAEEFEEPIRKEYGAIISAGLSQAPVKKLMDMAAEAYKKHWKLTQDERDKLHKQIEKALKNDKFDPPEEVTRMVAGIKDMLHSSEFVE